MRINVFGKGEDPVAVLVEEAGQLDIDQGDIPVSVVEAIEFSFYPPHSKREGTIGYNSIAYRWEIA